MSSIENDFGTSSKPNVRPPKVFTGCCIIAILINALMLYTVYSAVEELHEYIRRNDDGYPAKIEDSKFRVVAFPKHDAQQQRVHRAILVSLKELTQDTIEAFINNKPERIETSAFTALPDEQDEQANIAGLNRAINEWNADTEWKNVDFFINRLGNNGESVAKLTIRHKKGGRYEYLYRITPDAHVIPIGHVIYGRI